MKTTNNLTLILSLTLTLLSLLSLLSLAACSQSTTTITTTTITTTTTTTPQPTVTPTSTATLTATGAVTTTAPLTATGAVTTTAPLTATGAVTTTAPLTATGAVTTTAPLTATASQTPTLTLWTTEQGKALTMVHTLADQFSQQYGIALTVMPKDPDSLRVDMITADLRDSPTPHIIWGTHDDLANLLQDEAIQPITRITHTLSTDILTATRQSATYADQIWGYPLSAQDFLLLHYNKKLLDTPPQTTNQLIEQVRSIATTEPTPTTTDSANPLPRFGMVAAWGEPYWLLAWLNGMGGSITNTDGTLPTLNTEQMTNTLYLLRELYATAPPKQWGYEAMVNTYRAGEAVIAIDGVWSMATYREYTTTLALGMATMPIVPSTGRIAASPLGTSYLMIHRDTLGEMLTASHMFATFLMTPTVQLSLALQLQRLPVSLALLDSPEIGGDPVLALAAAQAPYAPSIPPTSTSRCALLAIRHYLPLVLAGDIAQPDGLERMQQAAETCMRGDRW